MHNNTKFSVCKENKLNLVYFKTMNRFGENLKQVRTEMGINQKQFAEMLQTTQQRVSEWERGVIEPTLSNIIKIIKVLGVTLEELID